MSLNAVLEASVKELAEVAGVPPGTWQNWRRNSDVPVCSLVRVCNRWRIPVGHFVGWSNQRQSLMLGRRHYQVDERLFAEVRFLNKAFGDEVTAVQGRKVAEFCDFVGMGRATFYRNFRKEDVPAKNLTMKQWLELCNKCRLYPMDFLTGAGVDVPLLEGYERKCEDRLGVLEKRCRELEAMNGRLQRQLAEEQAKVKRLTERTKE